jgi:uncharacterized membrane protein YozB (DUF420 family)
VKRLILVASLAILSAPYMANARGWNDDNRHHRKISADQMAATGLAVAAALGAVGYLVLRKRTTA